jgi:multiple sugar transport system ATP-binding protein
VTFVESLGSSTQAYCTLPGVEEALTCTLSGQSRVRDGEVLPLGVPASDCYLFDAQGQAFPRRRRAPAADAA